MASGRRLLMRVRRPPALAEQAGGETGPPPAVRSISRPAVLRRREPRPARAKRQDAEARPDPARRSRHRRALITAAVDIGAGIARVAQPVAVAVPLVAVARPRTVVQVVQYPVVVQIVGDVTISMTMKPSASARRSIVDDRLGLGARCRSCRGRGRSRRTRLRRVSKRAMGPCGPRMTTTETSRARSRP